MGSGREPALYESMEGFETTKDGKVIRFDAVIYFKTY
jgi:hypothetical protein